MEDSLRQFGQAGREGLSAAVDAGRALRNLIAADIALARAALVRALVWLVVAAVFGASAWLLLMAWLVAVLNGFGLSWPLALAIATALSGAVAALGAWKMLRYFGDANLETSRRQLARFGLGRDDGDDGDSE
ncbi:hypothetical protein CSC70_06215 [Pseudoxanthomonas kalamensis DSM 18571]|nr:hypothetical protein CSC70_06215 [Pseudoxanthomonas kalamensis DSM 18571]